MAASELEDPDSHLEEGEFGGPTKSFLEHLEDLRWTLMKCAAAVGVCFLACLFAAPFLVNILTWPLENSGIQQIERIEEARVTLLVGTNRIGSFNLDTNQPSIFGTNHHTVLELVPFQSGTNLLMGLQLSEGEHAQTLVGRRVELINLGPAAAFFTSLKMAGFGGIALASPFLFFFIGQFVLPALRLTEKKYAYWGLFFGTGLFMLGVLFCYFGLLPIALKAAVQYSEWMGFQVNDWRAEEYIGFVSKCLLGMGVAFELPVVILVLVKIGMLDYKKLSGFRMYMVVVNLVIAAILTPPDIVSQIILCIPLQVLYEVSVWITWYWERRDRKKAERGE
ncbi:MAG: twin-arginine translocase subunit TatC [Verrucomicrobia bacterium]|nr:twin-arginine translocase subunit TatC [Verrucomicrobiota bacterium]